MRILRLVVSSNWYLLGSLLVFSLVSTVPGAASVSYQSTTVVRKTESSVEISTYTAIPEATEPCTPAECEWWTQIRKAHRDLVAANEKGKQKSIAEAKEKFFLLLLEGQQKSYQVPLADRSPQMLVFGKKPERPDIAKKNQITGTVELSVELRADGSVGDVQIIKGLGFGINENVIQAARQYVFLPAVKSRAFVAERRNVKVEFSDKWSQKRQGIED